MKTLTGKINLSKIDKDNLFKSADTGSIYLDFKIMLREEEDKYGNHGMVVQQFQKENRKDASGEWVNTPILGNVKMFVSKDKAVSADDGQNDDLPF